MPGTKSISKIRGLYDLIDLYQNLDIDGDGLLGPHEVSIVEIAKGDRGGVGFAKQNRKDGFLSPWEVAQMRGFKPEDVQPLRIANQIFGRTFEDIEQMKRSYGVPVTRSVSIICKIGTRLAFHPNGRVAQAVLEEPWNCGHGCTLPAGTTILLDQWGFFKEARIDKAAVINHIAVPAGTTVRRDADCLIFSAERDHLVANGIPYQELALITSDSAVGTLARKTIAPLGTMITLDAIMHAGALVMLTAEMSIQRALDGPLWVNGIFCPAGSHFDTKVRDGMPIAELHPPKDEHLQFRGRRLQSATITGRPKIMELTFASTEEISLHGIRMKVSAMLCRPDGSVSGVELAQDLQSPYGSGIVHRAGESVALLRDGSLVEGSIEAFRHLYPAITLSGKYNRHEIETLIMNLDRLPPAVRESLKAINLSYKRESNANFLLDEAGHADPMNMTIYLWKDSDSYLDLSTIQHEAAHIFTFHQRSVVSRVIQRRTAHIDFSRYNPAQSESDYLIPSQVAEENAIIMQEMSRSFEERWLKIVETNGNPYGKVGRKKGSDTLNLEWISLDEKGNNDGPRYGFVRPYGSKNFYEDVATHVEMIWDNPALFRQLITSDSEFYKTHPEQIRYTQVYREKLKLLRDYGFITDEKYREIFPSAPLHPATADFCAREAVNCQ